MNKQRKEELKELSQIKDLLEKHLIRLIEERSNIPTDVFTSTEFILRDLINYYSSLSLLYKNNHQESSLIIARTIMEYVASLIFLYSKDTEKRANNFVLYPISSWIRGLKDTDDNEKKPEDKKIILEFLETEYANYKPEGSNKYHWSGMQIKEIFEEINMAKFYDMGYRRLSKFPHPSFKNKINLDDKTPYPIFLKKFITRDIFVATLTGLKLINEKYDLLEGGVEISDYPEEGIDFFFIINDKDYDKDGKSK